MTAQTPDPQDAKIIGYSNVTHEGVTLHFDRPVHVNDGLNSADWWLSWSKLGGALLASWYHECPPDHDEADARKDASIAEKRGLIQDLMATLANRNREIARKNDALRQALKSLTALDAVLHFDLPWDEAHGSAVRRTAMNAAMGQARAAIAAIDEVTG